MDPNGSAPPPSHPDLLAVHASMLSGLGQLAAYFGFPRVMGELYAALLLHPGAMSLDDLTERLAISKASVSTNVRTLEHLGMVRRVWTTERGDRRKFYEAETDFWQIITNLLAGREMRDVERALSVMDDNIERLTRVRPSLNANDDALAGHYAQRIEELEALFRFAQVMIQAILSQVQARAADEGQASNP